MHKCLSLALAGVLCFALTAAVAMPTAASAATRATGSRDEVAALKSANRALTAQIASANRSIGGRGTLARRVRTLRNRLGGVGTRRSVFWTLSGWWEEPAASPSGPGAAARCSAARAAPASGRWRSRRSLTAAGRWRSGRRPWRNRLQAPRTAARCRPSQRRTRRSRRRIQAFTTQVQSLSTQNEALTHAERWRSPRRTLRSGVNSPRQRPRSAEPGTLSDRLGALVTLVGGRDSLTDAITAVDDTLGGGGNLTTDSDNYVVAAGSTAATIVDAQSRIGGSGTLAERLDTVDSALGASGTIVARLTSLSDSILTAPTGDLAADVATLGDSLLTGPTGVLQTDLTSARELIGDPAATLGRPQRRRPGAGRNRPDRRCDRSTTRLDSQITSVQSRRERLELGDRRGEDRGWRERRRHLQQGVFVEQHARREWQRDRAYQRDPRCRSHFPRLDAERGPRHGTRPGGLVTRGHAAGGPQRRRSGAGRDRPDCRVRRSAIRSTAEIADCPEHRDDLGDGDQRR